MKEYLLKIKQIVAPKSKLEFGYYVDDNLPMKKEWLSVDAFVSETGFTNKIDFETAINELLAYIKKENYNI